MTDFFSAEEMSEILKKIAIEHNAFLHEGLKIVADKITKTAKDEIGEYQTQKFHFPAWQELAESTISEKERLGYSPPDNPLLRTGEMRDSIKNNVVGLTAYVGSTDEKAIYHEFGTSKMPMRPFIGPAAVTNIEFIKKTIRRSSISGLKSAGKKVNQAFKKRAFEE